MEPADQQDLVIVGGGIVGLCTAYYALQRGLAVTVVDRDSPEDSGCSFGNAGLVVPSHFVPLAAPGMISKGLRWMLDRQSPFFVRPRPSLDLARWGWLFWRHATTEHVRDSRELLRDLNLESRRLFAELAAEADDFGFAKRGLLMLCKTREGLDEEAALAAEARELGLDAEVLDAAATARLSPELTMDIVGSVHFREDCQLDPARLMRSLRARIRALGGTIEHGAEIERLEIERGRVTAAHARDQRFTGRQFLVAGGSWSAGLLRQAGLRLPLQPGKGYSLTLPTPPQQASLPAILCEAKVAVTPVGSALRFAGTMEVGGFERNIDPLRLRGIVRSVGRYFPRFSESDFDGVEAWAGLRPVSPDGIPYLGRVPGCENLLAATGHAMMGLSLGPVSGRLVADLVTGRKPLCPVERLDPGRFD